MGASAVAAVIVRREKELVAHFRSAGATSPQMARTADALGVHQEMAWGRLVDRAVIRTAPNGAFYLDELSWSALERNRRRMIAVVLGVLAVSTALLTGMTLLALRRR